MKILLIQQKMLGDVLTSTILLEALREQYPDAQLHYLIAPHCEAVIRHHPCVDHLHFYNEKTGSVLQTFKSLVRELRKERFDVVIDVYSKWPSALLTKLSGAPVRIGQYKSYLQFFYTHTFANNYERLSEWPLAYTNRLQLLEPLHTKPHLPLQPKIYISEEEKISMISICKKANLDFDQHCYVMVNLFGSNPSKTYPLTYFAKLLDKAVASQANLRLLLNYFPKQAVAVDDFCALCSPKTKKKIDLFYRADLREFMVLTSFCKAVIGNEGGAIHIGSALGLPTLALFSPWVTSDAWGLETNSNSHVSLHLHDYLPELFANTSKKTLQKKASQLYAAFIPELVEAKFLQFLNRL